MGGPRLYGKEKLRESWKRESSPELESFNSIQRPFGPHVKGETIKEKVIYG